jgi:hypothetical protein
MIAFRVAIALPIFLTFGCAAKQPVPVQHPVSSLDSLTISLPSLDEVEKGAVRSSEQSPRCKDWAFDVANKIAAATVAFQGEIVSTDDRSISDKYYSHQTLSFKVLKSLKGPYAPGVVVSTEVPVTDVCAGIGCIFPFRVGRVTLVLSPSEKNLTFFEQGCASFQNYVFVNSYLEVEGFARSRPPS